MADLVKTTGTDLPALVERARSALEQAKTHAEVLQARETAGLAYDAAKRAERLAKAKGAHDELIAAVQRVQADAVDIQTAAEIRLADEIEAAKARGEMAGEGRPRTVSCETVSKPVTTGELGLTRKEVMEGRILRDAEKANPGAIRKALDAEVAAGKSPTRAAAVNAAKKATGKLKVVNDPELQKRASGARKPSRASSSPKKGKASPAPAPAKAESRFEPETRAQHEAFRAYALEVCAFLLKKEPGKANLLHLHGKKNEDIEAALATIKAMDAEALDRAMFFMARGWIATLADEAKEARERGGEYGEENL